MNSKRFFICRGILLLYVLDCLVSQKTTNETKRKGERNMKNKKWLGAGLVVALIAVFALIFVNFSEKPVEGSKEISIEVINQAEESELYELKTDAEFLRQAMEEAEGLEFSGQESEYGLMVEVVNGESAIYDKDNAYWSFMVNGEYSNYGIDTQPIEDGDAFQIVYTEAE